MINHRPGTILVLLTVLLACLWSAGGWAQESGIFPEQEIPMARIVTGNERPAECLSSIHVREVDGEARQLPATAFELEPGIHTLHGTARVNLTYCQVNREAMQAGVPPLEAVFEEGKTYFVGLDHSSPDRSEWRIVIWKVEEAAD